MHVSQHSIKNQDIYHHWFLALLTLNKRIRELGQIFFLEYGLNEDIRYK